MWRMENNVCLIALFRKMGKPLSAKKIVRYSLHILEHGSLIVLQNGEIYDDTPKNRAMQFGKGYIITANDITPIPFTCWQPSKAVYSRMRATAKADTRATYTTTNRMRMTSEKLEGRSQMFREGMGRRTRKKPSNSGSFRVNPPLRGMALNKGDMERNRPDFIDYITYLAK